MTRARYYIETMIRIATEQLQIVMWTRLNGATSQLSKYLLAVALIDLLLWPSNAEANDYRWSANIAVQAHSIGTQQVETSLAVDGKGRIWLTFIDAIYRMTPRQIWIAWPRVLRLFVSKDAGRTFVSRENLSELGDALWLSPSGAGDIYAAYVQYPPENARGRVSTQIMVRKLEGDLVDSGCLPTDRSTKHDQSNIHAGKSGILYLIGMDIAFETPDVKRPRLLFSRLLDEGKRCSDGQRLDSVGQSPQVIETAQGIFIVGHAGYLLSNDGGRTFTRRIDKRFGQKIARIAISPDRKSLYVVGDGTGIGQGLMLYVTDDAGETWRSRRIDDSRDADEWRFPAIHVEQSGRVHVVWMDNRQRAGGLFHAFSEDGGKSFSANTRVSDKEFPFPTNAPPPPPANQSGTWIGNYLSVATLDGRVVVAWSDQREGIARSVVRVSYGIRN